MIPFLTLAIGFFGTFLEAAILLSLYGYFLLPLGAPILSYWHLYGISILINLITWQAPEYNLNEFTNAQLGLVKTCASILQHILVWIVGSIIYSLAGPF